MSDPKKHHYVPEFYLKGFCRDGMLWMHDRAENTYKRLSPEILGIKKNFYAFTDEDGRRDVSAEKKLSRVENSAAPVIRKLEAGQQITFEENCDLALFVALMSYRVPDFEQEHKEWHDTVVKAIHKQMFPSVEAVKAQISRQGKDPDDEAAQNIFEMIQDETYDVVTNKPYYIAQILDLGLNTAQQLASMSWLLIHAPEGAAFITSDDPFLLVPPRDYNPDNTPYGVGIVTSGAHKRVSLTQRLYLCIQDEGSEMPTWQADKRAVRAINEDTAKSHRRFLFGRDEALLRKAAGATVPLARSRPRIGHSRFDESEGTWDG